MARVRTGGANQLPLTTDGSIPVVIQRSIRRLEDNVAKLNSTDNNQQVQIDNKLGSSPSDLLSLAGYMRNALQATGSHPLSILNLPGTPIEAGGSGGGGGGGGGGSVTLGGDLSGNSAAAIVTGIRGRVIANVAPSDGQALVWSAANNEWMPETVASGYVLPPASATILGGVKIGSGISVAGDGTISVTPGAGGYWQPGSPAGAIYYGGGPVGIGTNVPRSLLSIIPSTDPTTPATATQIWIGEYTNNPAYGLQIGYQNAGGYFNGVIQCNSGQPSGPLLLNPLGGNVGIGSGQQTTSPSPTGTLTIWTQNTTGPNVTVPLLLDRIYGDVGDAQDIVFGGGAGNAPNRSAIIRCYANAGGESGLGFYTQTGSGDAANHCSVTILGNGNTGIGTTTPDQVLTVDGSAPIVEIRSGGYLQMRPSANNWDMRLQATGNQLNIYTGSNLNTPVASFGAGNQNVGIGTASPNYQLSIVPVWTGTPNSYQSATQLWIHEGTGNSVYGLQLGYGYDTAYPQPWFSVIQSWAGGGGWPIQLNPAGGNVMVATTTAAAQLTVAGGGDLYVGNTAGPAGFYAQTFMSGNWGLSNINTNMYWNGSAYVTRNPSWPGMYIGTAVLNNGTGDASCGISYLPVGSSSLIPILSAQRYQGASYVILSAGGGAALDAQMTNNGEWYSYMYSTAQLALRVRCLDGNYRTVVFNLS